MAKTADDKLVIEPLRVNLQREDWNLIVDKLNEIIEVLNK